MNGQLNRAINHKSLSDFVCIFAVIVLTVCGQLILKWQVAKAGAFPESFSERALFLLRLLLNPWIIGGLFAGFLAFLCWMAAMTKFELSYAYPFMSLAFVFVLILSAIFFHETVTMPKMIGVMLIVAGIIIGSRG
jgi:multidrug transporter EmrE-like cation transporter